MFGDKLQRVLKRTFVKDEGMFDYHPNGRKRRERRWIDKSEGIRAEIGGMIVDAKKLTVSLTVMGSIMAFKLSGMRTDARK